MNKMNKLLIIISWMSTCTLVYIVHFNFLQTYPPTLLSIMSTLITVLGYYKLTEYFRIKMME